jgi:DNA-binding CsgD family transcriptional regulator
LLDRKLRVRSVFIDGMAGAEPERLLCNDRTRLRPEIVAFVKAFVDDLRGDDRCSSLLVRIDEESSVRLWALASEEKQLVALVIEGDRSGDRISDAAVRFGLTRRQVDVLRLTLEGANAGEIARVLNISEYTAQGYVKTLLAKTGSRNRASMVAKVLDWEAFTGSRLA